jgi:cytochrome P450
MTRIVSDLDPFSPEFRADPYVHYARMRALGPVIWLERYGIWAVSRYDAVKAALSDHGTFSNAGGGGLANYFVDPPWRRPSIILEVDPPEHDRARKVLLRVFSRPALQALRPAFERHGEMLIDRALAAGTLDAVSELVQPFPLTVFGDAVGLEPEDRHPSLARSAFEEATRYDSSSQSVIRTTLHEVEFFGARMGRHDKVMVLLGSAGRDPDQWEAPDVFDVRRQLAGQVGYGAGIHGCVAQMMARLEGQVFFEVLAQRAEILEAAGPPQLRLGPGLRGLSSLQLAIR